jgi:hypothetical protein
MDYTEVCQGWIYCITNKVNGKKYIGQTNNFERRKKEHFSIVDEGNVSLRNAFIKYGVENFTMESILTFNAINKKVLRKVLNQLEIFYISKYDTFNKNKGYNFTKGGKGNLGFKHTEESKRKMSEVHKEVSKIGEMSSKPVLLYNLNGTFSREYKSVRDAVRAVGGNENSYSNAMYALRDGRKKLHGYLWRYKTTDMFPIFIEPYLWPTSKTIYHYSIDGRLIGEYSCAYEAAEKLGIPVKKIWKSARNKRIKARTDYWSYEAPAA